MIPDSGLLFWPPCKHATSTTEATKEQ